MPTKIKQKPAPNDLRVWHIPQVPGEAFRVSVASVDEAKTVLRVLADYDLSQLEHRIKPDFANVQGLEVFDDGEWVEWMNENGDDIGAVILEHEEKAKRRRAS